MCRIAGIISGERPVTDSREKVMTMCMALKHGGPDDEGLYCDNEAGLVFGHRRLAIIDLSQNGHQPMADSIQRVWITFNGEIYNYLELKEQLLGLGAQFNSNTDTEVIINAYMFWGMAAFSMLRGIFAFALYDKLKAITYLVRDSSGVKPLYYHIRNQQLSFASEVNALKMAGIADIIDDTWKVRFLAFGHIPEPHTTLKNVYSLPKGQFLCWHHKKNTHEIHSYHIAGHSSEITDPREARGAIRSSLTKAVNRQLMADAPIGVFLSGGTDSSIITFLANQQKHARLKTVSIFFNEKEYDERMYQDLMLKQIEGEKFAHLVRPEDFEEFLPEILRDMDMPTTDGINTWFISKYAREDGLKAVLSGVGADELFGGYPSFRRIKYLKNAQRVPAFLLRGSEMLTSGPYKKISFLGYNHPLAHYLLLRGLFAPKEIARILNMELNEVEDILFDTNDLPILNKYDAADAAWFELNLYMQNQLLHDTDIMGMSHGLEVRVPFLDEDFKQVAESIIPQARFDTAQPKKLLVDSFNDVLPTKIWDRTKMGFTFPLQQWMKSHKEINNESSYKGKNVRTIVRDFKNNSVHWSKVFALYQLQIHD
jgi:asparagine synthase (glutamine-hydrolysing)